MVLIKAAMAACRDKGSGCGTPLPAVATCENTRTESLPNCALQISGRYQIAAYRMWGEAMHSNVMKSSESIATSGYDLHLHAVCNFALD